MWQGNGGHEFQVNEIRTPPGRTPWFRKEKASGGGRDARLEAAETETPAKVQSEALHIHTIRPLSPYLGR